MSPLRFRYGVPEHAIVMHDHLATYWNIHNKWNHIWFKNMCTPTRKYCGALLAALKDEEEALVNVAAVMGFNYAYEGFGK